MARVPTADGKAIVWYQEGERVEQAQARYYARILPGIWRRLTPTFREPPSDAGVPCYHGPDGRFDVYVNRTVTWLAGRKGRGIDRGVTVPYPARAGRWCTGRPSWMAIDQNEPRFVLAHELMHAIQLAYRYASCQGNAWWDEGSANWAGDFVYPRDNVEREWPEMVQNPLGAAGLTRADYEAWPFWMALERTYGASVLRAIFARLATAPSPRAVDAAIPGGLKRQWPRFAAVLLNQAPVGTPGFALPKSFKAWDGWSQTPALAREATLGVKQTLRLASQNPGLGPLTVDAYHRVRPAGRAVREIRFKNGSPRAGVLALLQTAGGRWTLADWSGRREVTLCRDRPEENVQRLILVTVNSGVSGRLPRFAHQLTGGAACETPTYLGRVTGSMDTTFSEDFCPSHTHLSYSATLAGVGGSTMPFPVAAGTEAGPFGGDAADYGVSGSGTHTSPPCADDGDPGCSTGLAPDPTAPQGQASFRVSGATVNVNLDSPTYGPTSEACGGFESNGFLHGSFPLARARDATITVPLSENRDTGVVRRTGSGTLTLRRVG